MFKQLEFKEGLKTHRHSPDDAGQGHNCSHGVLLSAHCIKMPSMAYCMVRGEDCMRGVWPHNPVGFNCKTQQAKKATLLTAMSCVTG